jgi:hypothetical protein
VSPQNGSVQGGVAVSLVEACAALQGIFPPETWTKNPFLLKLSRRDKDANLDIHFSQSFIILTCFHTDEHYI